MKFEAPHQFSAQAPQFGGVVCAHVAGASVHNEAPAIRSRSFSLCVFSRELCTIRHERLPPFRMDALALERRGISLLFSI